MTQSTFEVKMEDMVSHAFEVAYDFLRKFDDMIDADYLNTPYKYLYRNISLCTTVLSEEFYKKQDGFTFGSYNYFTDRIRINIDYIAYWGLEFGWTKEEVAGKVLSTIAHEIGHALHAKLENEDYLKFRYKKLYLMDYAERTVINNTIYQIVVQHQETKANTYAVEMVMPLVEQFNVACYKEFVSKMWYTIASNGTAEAASLYEIPMAS